MGPNEKNGNKQNIIRVQTKVGISRTIESTQNIITN